MLQKRKRSNLPEGETQGECSHFAASMTCPWREIRLDEEAARVSLGTLKDGIPTRISFGSAA